MRGFRAVLLSRKAQLHHPAHIMGAFDLDTLLPMSFINEIVRAVHIIVDEQVEFWSLHMHIERHDRA